MHPSAVNLLAILVTLSPVMCLPETSEKRSGVFGFSDSENENSWQADVENRGLLSNEVLRTLQHNTDDTVVIGHPENKNDFLDWLIGLIGITTTQAPPTQKPPEECKPCACGKPNKKHRIVGGHETEVLQYPWMAALIYNKNFFCGGTLINDQYVLTATHCINRIKKENLIIRLLEHDRYSSQETTVINRKVKRLIPHPRFDSNTYNNDVALIQLEEPVELVGDLRPACLPVRSKSFTGYNATVIGWGATEEGGSASNVLNEVVVPIISNEECRNTKYGKDKITDNMLCAGYPEGMKDSCQGDSGGGLFITNSTTDLFHTVGVVSWGNGCAQPDYPGVYARVNRYLTWIKNNTIDSCPCEPNMQYFFHKS